MAIIDDVVTVYITATGEITLTAGEGSWDTDFLQAGESYIEEYWDGESYYIQGGTGVLRPLVTWSTLSILGDGVASTVTSGLPSTTHIQVISVAQPESFIYIDEDATDGVVTLTCNHPTTLQAILTNIFPYTNNIWEIEVT